MEFNQATSQKRTRNGFRAFFVLLTLEACLILGTSGYGQESCCHGSIPYVRGCQRFCPNYCNGLGACFVQGGYSQYSCLPRDLYGCSPQGGVLPPPEFFRHVQVSRAHQEMADPMPEPSNRKFEEVPSQSIPTPPLSRQTPVSLPQPTSEAAPPLTPAVPEIPSPQPLESAPSNSQQGTHDPVRLPTRLANRRESSRESQSNQQLERVDPRDAYEYHVSRSPEPVFESSQQRELTATPQLELVVTPERHLSMPEPRRVQVDPPVQTVPLEVFPEPAAPARQKTALDAAPELPKAVTIAPVPTTTEASLQTPPAQEYYVVIEKSMTEKEDAAAPPQRPVFVRTGRSLPSTNHQESVVPLLEQLEPAESSLPAIPRSLRITEAESTIEQQRAQGNVDAAPQLPLEVGSIILPESAHRSAEFDELKSTLRVRNVVPTAVRPTAIVTGVKGCSYQEQIDTPSTTKPATDQAPLPPLLSKSNRTSLRVLSVR